MANAKGQAVIFEIDPTERYLFLGKTESGKTYAAKSLLREVAKKWPVVIIDPKHFWLGKHPKWARRGEPGTIDKPHLVKKFNPKLHVQVYQPTAPAIKDENLNRLCFDILRWAARNSGVFVFNDEIMECSTAASPMQGINSLMTQGRALEVGAWNASQRPLRIPETVRSQSEKWFVFYIGGSEDRKMVAKELDTPAIIDDKLRDHQYFYYDVKKMDHAVKMPAFPKVKGA